MSKYVTLHGFGLGGELQDKTVMPANIDQNIMADNNFDGLYSVTVIGDEDLTADNIKKGINLFGIDGNYNNLNFEIVGGTSTPSNPKENMIWVNTAEPITGYTFMYEEPKSLDEGTVWIKTNASSDLKFNALKADKIEVYPISAMQYISSNFVAKEIKIYQNGNWNDFGILDLGLTKSLWGLMPKMQYYKSYNGTGTNLTLSGSQSGDGQRYSAIYYLQPIDLGSYSQISVTLTGKTWANGAYGTMGMTVGVTKDLNITTHTSFTKYQSFGTYSGTLVIDVSDLTGEYYLGIAIYISGYTGASFDVTNITFTA